MRRKFLLPVAALALALVTTVTLSGSVHADANDFTFQSFEADYYLEQGKNARSTMHVQEVLRPIFPRIDQNHGILRSIPETYHGHPLKPQVNSVTNGKGERLHYETSHSNDNIILKIGDADTYVHGMQEYHIDYTIHDVTSKYEDYDELYWDVNGDGWSQNFSSVVARVHIPENLASHLGSRQKCFTGSYGSTQQQCEITVHTQQDSTQLITFTTKRELLANQTLTFVMDFADNTFAQYQKTFWEKMWPYILAIGIAGPPLAAAVIMVIRWRRFGRDAKGKGIIVPQYLPPKEVSVLGAGALLKEKVESFTITAQIIDLAVRHFLKIYETKEVRRFQKDKKGYEIELVREVTSLRSEEKEVAHMLFGESAKVGKRVKLEVLKSKMTEDVTKLSKQVETQLTQAGYFKKEPRKAVRSYSIVGIILIALGFFGMPFTLGVTAAGIIVLIVGQFMSARTIKGVTLKEYLMGLKVYMQVAEADRLKVLQSPNSAMTQKIDVTDRKQLVKLYEKLLPYAMLFHIETEWIKEFADMYDHAPDWYVGSSTFNAVYFATAFSGFATTSTQTLAPPSSSSSSGFSSGGGFSGGGGGGGGGGGW